MYNVLRNYFSGNRHRYKDGEFDLDLTYITERIIAMGFPSSRFEKLYRNSIEDVANFLQKKHQDKYLVINLSGRKYDYSYFKGRVIEAGFPDHHSPPLSLMWSIYSIIDFWLALDEQNVVAIHCLAGKGRTGITIICTLLMQGYFNNLTSKSTLEVINAAINFFHDKRGDGIENADQIRFIYQFLQSMPNMGCDVCLQTNKTLQPKIYITSLILYNLPTINPMITPKLCIFLKRRSGWNIVFNSKWSSFSDYNLAVFHSAFVFTINQTFTGDLLFVFYDKDSPQFHFSVSTLLLPRGTASNPSSLFLNSQCISFEKDCYIAFPQSFSAQILCFRELDHCAARLANDAIEQEETRRRGIIRSLPSFHSALSSPKNSNLPPSDPPYLTLEAKTQFPAQREGLSMCDQPLLIRRRQSKLSRRRSRSLIDINTFDNTHITETNSLQTNNMRSRNSGIDEKALIPVHSSHLAQKKSLSAQFSELQNSLQNLSLASEPARCIPDETLSYAQPTSKHRNTTGCFPPSTTLKVMDEGPDFWNSSYADQLFQNAVPIDQIIAISVTPENKGTSTEVQMKLPPDASANIYFYPSEEIRCKFMCQVMVEGVSKKRLVVLTTNHLRVMKTPDSIRTKINIELRPDVIRSIGISQDEKYSAVFFQNISETPKILFQDTETAQKFVSLLRSQNSLPGRDPYGTRLDVVTRSEVVSVSQYMQEEQKATKINITTMGIVKKLKKQMDVKLFDRLKQIVEIPYPSPWPVIKAFLEQRNKELSADFENNQNELYAAIRSEGELNSQSMSNRSFNGRLYCCLLE